MTTPETVAPIPPTGATPVPNPRQSALVTAGWMIHWLLRMYAAAMFLIYGFSKVFLMQMGQVDYPEMLITVGEKSPMGLLWLWMGYSPVVQFSAGLIEVLIGVMLLWRRSAGLGALFGVAAGFSIWVLNMTYDVPVKTLSGALTLLCLLLAIPWIPRALRFLAGQPTGAATLPTAIPFPKLDKITRFFPLLAVIAVAAVPFTVTPPGTSFREAASPVAGIWRAEGDPEWSTLAFGSHEIGRAPDSDDTLDGMASARTASGDLVFGTYDTDSVDGSVPTELTVTFDAPLGGDRNLGAREDGERVGSVGDPEAFTVTLDGDALTLKGKGRELTATRDHERMYLLEKEPTWGGMPVNR